jgi:hypothetical protein
MERGENGSSAWSARSSIPSADATPNDSRVPTPPDHPLSRTSGTGRAWEREGGGSGVTSPPGQPQFSRPQTPQGPGGLAASSVQEARVSSARRRLPAASVSPRAPYVFG